MEQYIEKSALVAEIEKTEKCAKHKAKETPDKYWQIHFDGQVTACRSIMSFLDTLEVKEVDLEKEFFDWHHEEKNRDYNASILYERYSTTSKKLAKHFFELGLKTKGE